jgi:hypothetical protein
LAARLACVDDQLAVSCTLDVRHSGRHQPRSVHCRGDGRGCALVELKGRRLPRSNGRPPEQGSAVREVAHDVEVDDGVADRCIRSQKLTQLLRHAHAILKRHDRDRWLPMLGDQRHDIGIVDAFARDKNHVGRREASSRVGGEGFSAGLSGELDPPTATVQQDCSMRLGGFREFTTGGRVSADEGDVVAVSGQCDPHSTAHVARSEHSDAHRPRVGRRRVPGALASPCVCIVIASVYAPH